MDREDIQQLIDQLDAAIDNISEIMDKMCMYQVGEATDGAKKMATITAKAMKEIRKSIGYMKELPQSRSAEQESVEIGTGLRRLIS